METLTLTQKEQARLQVLNSLLAEHMTLDQAATLMGVSARHTRRILAAYRREGAAALAHGNRGLRSTNATPEPLRSEVLRLAQTRYPDANHTHLSELLREREGIEIGRTTLRRILTGAGLKSPRRRRPPRHRVRRQRMPREGMLVQVDGSHHRWLGDDGPPFALLLLDDAKCPALVNALFCELLPADEGADTALRRTHRPLDRHSVFKNRLRARRLRRSGGDLLSRGRFHPVHRDRRLRSRGRPEAWSPLSPSCSLAASEKPEGREATGFVAPSAGSHRR